MAQAGVPRWHTRPIYDLLLVEDRPYDVEVIRAVLKDGNHRLRFNSVPVCPHGEAIFVLREMRQHEIWKLIPIVALVSDDWNAKECYQLFVNACIEKPTSLDALAAVVVSVDAFWFSVPLLLPPEWKLLSTLREINITRDRQGPRTAR
jgi:hypothetical protein